MNHSAIRMSKFLILTPLLAAVLFVVSCGGSAPAEPPAAEKAAVEAPAAKVNPTPADPVAPAASSSAPTGTMTVALENLGAEVTDPILQSRAGHAQYQAPIYDALLGFNYESQYGGLGRGVAE